MKSCRQSLILLIVSAFLILGSAQPVTAQYKYSAPAPPSVPAPDRLTLPSGHCTSTTGFPTRSRHKGCTTTSTFNGRCRDTC